MVVLMIMVFAIVATLIKHADNRLEEKSKALVEEDQRRYYEWLDDNVDPITAHEWKAKTETFIRDYWDSIGREYRTSNVNEVSTRKERRAIHKGEKTNRKLSEEELTYINKNMLPALTAEQVEAYAPVTLDEGKKRYAEYLVSMLGISFDEAMSRVDKMRSETGI